MIRRINKNNDLKDLIKSCPSGVIDDIYEIRYYIYGYNDEITATFEKKGDILEVILPTSVLQSLPNGILYRRAFYKVVDTSYPDGYYNLEFEDNLNIWLDDGAETSPVDRYVTESELSSTLSSYATQSWVSSQEFATETWVENKSYITSSALEGYATESWVSSQEFATESWVSSQSYLNSDSTMVYDPSFTSFINNWLPSPFLPCRAFNTESSAIFFGRKESGHVNVSGLLISKNGKVQIMENNCITDIATYDWVRNHCLSSTALEGYATESWVQSQGYLTSVPDTFATKEWVSEQSYITSTALEGYATESWVVSQSYITSEALSGYATESWVQSQGYLTSVPSEYATESWVQSQGYLTSETIPSNIATESWVQSQGYLTSVPDTFATKEWVSEQGYITSTGLEGLATQSWVSSNFLSSTALEGYATQSWVSDKGYLTTENLSDYLLKSNSSDGFTMNFNPASAIISLKSSFSSTKIKPGGFYASNSSHEEANINPNVITLWNISTQTHIGMYIENYNIPRLDIGNLQIYSDYISKGNTSITISDIATKTWVSSQGYLTSVPDTYASQAWVSSNFLSATALTGYATESWVSSNFLSLSSIWIGSLTAWLNLSPQEQAFYTIALITE